LPSADHRHGNIELFLHAILFFAELQAFHRFLHERRVEKRFGIAVFDSLRIEARPLVCLSFRANARKFSPML
jgi:hypothetical protein